MYFRPADRCYLLLYVDDVLIAAGSTEVVDNVKKLLTAKWQWSDIGEAAFMLGFKIERNRDANEIRLNQSAYIRGVLERFGMEHANAVNTPVENFSLVKPERFDVDKASPAELREYNDRRTLYQSNVGSIMWCAVSTRPDLGFAAGYLSRFNSNPAAEHLKAAKRVHAYLKGSLALGLVFGRRHKMKISSLATATQTTRVIWTQGVAPRASFSSTRGRFYLGDRLGKPPWPYQPVRLNTRRYRRHTRKGFGSGDCCGSSAIRPMTLFSTTATIAELLHSLPILGTTSEPGTSTCDITLCERQSMLAEWLYIPSVPDTSLPTFSPRR
jgi:hypothetical protein